MESSILEEANFIARPYSILRSAGFKWRFQSQKGESLEPVTIKKEISMTVITIQRGEYIDTYKTNHLSKRSLLRQNPALFKIFQYIWETINPFKTAGISDKVYLGFFNAAYQQIKRDISQEIIEKNLIIDKKVDFSGKTWLNFTELYDSVFEFLDSYTKSTSSIEYICLLKSINTALQDMKWSSHLNLYSKLHIPLSAKAYYHPWMVVLIKANDKKSQQDDIPDIIKIPNDFHVSERLLKRKQFKPVDRENFNVRKLEIMMNIQFMKEFKLPQRCATQQTSRPKLFDKKPCSFNQGHLDKISPLSCILKQSKSKTSLIERVVDERKTLNFKTLSQKDLLR